MSNTENKVKKQYIAAIDLGSRNCCLIIGYLENEIFYVIQSSAKLVILGSDVLEQHKFSTDAIAKTVDIMSQFVNKIRQYPNIKFKIISTEATRIAKNKKLLINQLKKNLQIKLEVISSQEEAYYAVLGCLPMIRSDSKYAIIFDIGGCSTEISLIKHHNKDVVIIDTISIPLGVVSIIEQGKSIKYGEILTIVKKSIKIFNEANDINELLATEQCQIISASGTAAIIAALNMNLKIYDIDKINKASLFYDEYTKIIQFIQSMSREQLESHPCIGKYKADYVVGSLAIFEGICSEYKSTPIEVSNSGVCMGVIQHIIKNA